ncbi:MAG: hypothetical protein EZS28_047674, partial [Streblomastix strix]
QPTRSPSEQPNSSSQSQSQQQNNQQPTRYYFFFTEGCTKDFWEEKPIYGNVEICGKAFQVEEVNEEEKMMIKKKENEKEDVYYCDNQLDCGDIYDYYSQNELNIEVDYQTADNYF